VGWIYWIFPSCDQIQKGQRKRCGALWHKNNILMCHEIGIFSIGEIKEMCCFDPFFGDFFCLMFSLNESCLFLFAPRRCFITHFHWAIWFMIWRDLFENILNAYMPSRNRAFYGVCTPLSIPHKPWSKINMGFVLGLPITKNGHNSIL
jgi:hypothetical protein